MTICPQCGYNEGKLNVNPMNNFMNEYVDSTSGKTSGVFNDDRKTIDIKGVKLTRKDLWEAPKVVEPVKK